MYIHIHTYNDGIHERIDQLTLTRSIAELHTYNSDSFHSNIYYLLLHTTKPHISLLSTQNHKISLTAHSTPFYTCATRSAERSAIHLRGV